MASSDTQFIQINFDQKQLEDCLKSLAYIKDGAATACMRALNKTVTGCITDTAKAIYDEINLTQARIKKDITFKKATKLILSASVSSKGKKIELMEFGARQVAQGVTFQIKRSGPRTQMHYGFMDRGKSTGNLHVMRRGKNDPFVGAGTKIGVPKAGYLWGFPGYWSSKYRAGTHIKYGPSVPDIMGKAPVFSDIEAKAAVRLVDNLAHETDFLISQNTPSGDGGD